MVHHEFSQKRQAIHPRHVLVGQDQVDGVVLSPHFTDKGIPGWFDKSLPWRRADRERLQDVLLLAPSAEYLAGLPHGKLPDRSDFKRYATDLAGRMAVWRRAVAESERLADDLAVAVAAGPRLTVEPL